MLFFHFQRNAKSQFFECSLDFSHGIENEQKLLEKRLLEQQRQSEEDSRWLAREEVLSQNINYFVINCFLLLFTN